MALLDDRGRLFGKINLIDAAVVLLLFGLVPLGFASWQLFRLPPTFVASEVFVMRPLAEGQRYQLKGQNLRPFLRVFIGDAPARFLFDTPDHGEVLLPALPAGKYDLKVYDDTHEVARLTGVIAVVADDPPVVSAIVPSTLEFTRAPQHLVISGQRLPPAAKVMIGSVDAGYQRTSATAAELTVPALQPGVYDLVMMDGAQELVRSPKAVTVPKPVITRISPSVLDVQRDPQRVEFFGKHLQSIVRVFVAWKEVGPQFLSPEQGEFALPALPAGRYDLALFDASGTVEYSRLRNAVTVQAPTISEVTVRVRFLVRPEVLAIAKSAAPAPPGSPAMLVSLREGQELIGTTKPDLKEGPMVAVEAVLRLQASRKAEGIMFDGQVLRAGAPFTLRMPTYQMVGDILTLDAPSALVR